MALLGTDRRPVPDALPTRGPGPRPIRPRIRPARARPRPPGIAPRSGPGRRCRPVRRRPVRPPDDRELAPPAAQQELADALAARVGRPVNDALAVLVDQGRASPLRALDRAGDSGRREPPGGPDAARPGPRRTRGVVRRSEPAVGPPGRGAAQPPGPERRRERARPGAADRAAAAARRAGVRRRAGRAGRGRRPAAPAGLAAVAVGGGDLPARRHAGRRHRDHPEVRRVAAADRGRRGHPGHRPGAAAARRARHRQDLGVRAPGRGDLRRLDAAGPGHRRHRRGGDPLRLELRPAARRGPEPRGPGADAGDDGDADAARSPGSRS